MKIIKKCDVMHLDGQYKHYRIPGIIATDNGVLICCFECRENPSSDWGVSDIGMKRSFDGGETWEPLQIIASGNGKNVSNNPVMIADGSVVHFIWQENYKRAFYAKSYDDGATWTDTVEITDAFEEVRQSYGWTIIATGPGHGIKLSNGRLIVPVWLASNRSNIYAHAPSVSGTLYSDDGGETWKLGKLIDGTMTENPNECDLAQLSDGSVMINIRNTESRHQRCVAISRDFGETFEDITYDTQLIDPICDAGLISIGKELYFSNCADKEGRVNLTLKQSVDDGKTWSDSLLLEEYGGYSDLAYCSQSDSIFAFYECNDYTLLRIAEIKRYGV